MPDPHDIRPHAPETRGDDHPDPLTRRRFLQRSAMAVAGGVLFSCTGGSKIPKLTPKVNRIDTQWPIKRVVYLRHRYAMPVA